MVLTTMLPVETRSCGPYIDVAASRIRLFDPQLLSIPALEPFYYSQDFVSGYSGAAVTADYRRNCEEWQQFAGREVSAGDIYVVQYETEPDDFLKAVEDEGKGLLQDNSFFRWMLLPANKAVLDYFVLAKRSEFAQFGEKDPWDENADYKLNMLQWVAAAAERECNRAANDFLRQRYAYQAIKSLHYIPDTNGRHSAKLRALYEQHLKEKRTIVADWAMLYYAFAQEEPAQRTHYLVLSFDQSGEKQGAAFQHIGEEALDTLEQNAKDPEMLARINALRALRTPGKALPYLEALARLQPRSKYLPLLVAREINKLEDWLWSPEITGFESEVRQRLFYSEREDRQGSYDTTYRYFAVKNHLKDREYMTELRSFLNRAPAGGSLNRNFIALAVIHLDHIAGDFGRAASRLRGLPAFADPAMERQRLIELAVSTIHLEDINRQSVQEELLGYLQRLKKPGEPIAPRYEHYNEADDWIRDWDDDAPELLLLLSQRFRREGDLVKAGLIYLKAGHQVNEYDGYPDTSRIRYFDIAFFDRYASPQDIDRLLAFKRKSGKTRFESFIEPQRWAPDDWYRDLKATMLIRQKQYHRALKVMEEMDPGFWAANYEFARHLPRRSILSAGTLVPGRLDSGRKYPYVSKKLILAEITRSLDAAGTASNNLQRARHYYALGNAMYHLSHHGKAWMMYSYGHSMGELESRWSENMRGAFFSFRAGNETNRQDYYECREAIRMYEKAWELGRSDKDFAIMPLTMLIYCDKIAQKYRANAGASADGIFRSDPDGKANYNSAYLQRLQKYYKDSRLLERYETHCPDLLSRELSLRYY